MSATRISQALRDEILERLTEGETLRSICRDKHMPTAGGVRKLVLSNLEFSQQYARAREVGYAEMADEMLEIADTGDTERNRLQVDTRKWLLSKALPKIYGEKINLTPGPDNSITIKVRRVGREEAGAE